MKLNAAGTDSVAGQRRLLRRQLARCLRRFSVGGLALATAVLLPLATPLAAIAATSASPSPSPSPSPSALAPIVLESPPPSTPSSPVNTAIAYNTTNNSHLFKLAFSVVRIATDVVNPSNAAIAISSCTACSTVAIAVQIVLVTSPTVTTYTPGNAAVAVNYGCTLCTTSAYAYQFVVQAGGPVHFTERGREELDAIREGLEAVGQRSDLSPADRQAAIAALMQRLAQVLATQLVGPDEKGQHQNPTSDERVIHASPSPSASPSASPTISPAAASPGTTAPATARPSSSPIAPAPNPSPTGGASPAPAPSPTK